MAEFEVGLADYKVQPLIKELQRLRAALSASEERAKALEEALRRMDDLVDAIDHTLRCGAAEYVPAIPDVFGLIDREKPRQTKLRAALSLNPGSRPDAPMREIVFADPVADDNGWLVTLECGHKLLARDKKVSYPCLECKVALNPGSQPAKGGDAPVNPREIKVPQWEAGLGAGSQPTEGGR